MSYYQDDNNDTDGIVFVKTVMGVIVGLFFALLVAALVGCAPVREIGPWKTEVVKSVD